SGKSGIIAHRFVLGVQETVVADAGVAFVCIDLRTKKAVALEGELGERLMRLMA
ncbi:MAG TPA: thioesterase, partial [Pantoea agglomerans]|nr:thioesterase [Pantoea agglomerans]